MHQPNGENGHVSKLKAIHQQQSGEELFLDTTHTTMSFKAQLWYKALLSFILDTQFSLPN